MPVFLDSVDLSNLTLLFTEGVHQSDVLVLLATRKVFSRPWCLLEIHEALEKGIPVVVVVVAGRGFDWARARDHLARLEETLPASALDEIREHVGDDIEPFKRKLMAAVAYEEQTVVVAPRLSWHTLPMPAAGSRRRLSCTSTRRSAETAARARSSPSSCARAPSSVGAGGAARLNAPVLSILVSRGPMGSGHLGQASTARPSSGARAAVGVVEGAKA